MTITNSKKESIRKKAELDLLGKKFGKLLIIEVLHTNNYSKRMVKCLCDCGNEKIATIGNIKNKTQSCGCFKKEEIKRKFQKPIEDIAVKHILAACKRNHETTLTFEDVKTLIYSECYYCEQKPDVVGTIWKKAIDDGRSIKRIGIDRVDNSKSYSLDNVVPCCFVCNKIKRDLSVEKLVKILEKMLPKLKELIHE